MSVNIPKLMIPEECWDGVMEYFLKGLKGSTDSEIFKKALALGLFVKKPQYLDESHKCTEIPADTPNMVAYA